MSKPRRILYWVTMILVLACPTVAGTQCEITYEPFSYQLTLDEVGSVPKGRTPGDYYATNFPGASELYIFTLLKNDGTEPICLLRVRITWYNEQDEVVHTTSWVLDGKQAAPLLPGEAYPLAISWDSRLLPDLPSRYDIDCKVSCCSDDTGVVKSLLQTTNLRLFDLPDTELRFTGVVTNHGAEPVDDYMAYVVLYNGEDEIVGVGTFARWGWVTGFSLDAAESEPFQIDFDMLSGFIVSRDVARFEVYVHLGTGWQPLW